MVLSGLKTMRESGERLTTPGSLMYTDASAGGPVGSEMQRIRDAPHLFAISYRRQLGGKRMTRSVLDDVKGLGPTRRKRLTKELGGVAGVKAASLDQLRALSWPPDDVAAAVYGKIHGDRVGRGRAP